MKHPELAAAVLVALAASLAVSTGCERAEVHCLRAPADGSEPTCFAARDTRTRILLIGLDGASWNVMNPLLRQGRLPNLARLMQIGAHGPLKTLDEGISPVIWTSVATGKTGLAHGINSFGTRKSDGKWTPVTSNQRKVQAFWNILSDLGRTVGVVGWWATWPAEAVNGYMVTDRVSDFRWKAFFNAESVDAHLTHPPELIQDLLPLVLAPDQLGDEVTRRFLGLSTAELRARGCPDCTAPIHKEFHFAYPMDTSYRNVALRLLERSPDLDLLALYLRGIDTLSHVAMRRMVLTEEGEIVDDGSKRLSGLVSDYYAYTDELVGSVLERIDEDTVVFVISDHGFEPQGDGFNHTDGTAPDGIIIVSGKHVKPGPLAGAHIMDITPTLLHFLGLPVGEDMDGQVIAGLFDPAFQRRHPIATIASWETGPRAASQPVESPVDEEIEERLEALGYILE